jgi:hypothetical protein
MNEKKATSPEKKAALEMIRSEFKGTVCRDQAGKTAGSAARFQSPRLRRCAIWICIIRPARIQQLRKQGTRSKTHWQTVETESGDKHRVGLYVLEVQP